MDLQALKSSYPNGSYSLTVFCPWCDGLHYHGETYGRRGRHCDPGAGTPYGGYTLIEGRTGRSPAEAWPKAPFCNTPETLRRAFANGKDALRRAMATIVLGNVTKGKAGSFTRALPDGSRVNLSVSTVFNREAAGQGGSAFDLWQITRGRRHRDGKGLMDLVETLYAVPAGVLAVRVLETALGLTLDAQAARDVSEAIDRWRDRKRAGEVDVAADGSRA